MAGGDKTKIYVVVKSKVLPMDTGAKAGAKGILPKLVLASDKAAARDLPSKFSTKENAKPKKNSRPYDAIILIPKVKLTTESKGSGLRVTAICKLEVGAYKVSKKQTFMITTNISSKAAAEGGKFPSLADQAISAVVEHLAGKTLKSPGLKAKLKQKGFDL
jgi:hypothetical protein